MVKLSESALVSRMRDIYRSRLQEIMGEVRVRDEAGNILVSPGLKVRHGDTGFEYTVDSVSEDPDTRQINVTLRKPEVPRFDPPGEHFVGESGSSEIDASSYISHVDRLISTFGDNLNKDHEESSVTFVVNQQDFEEDYDLDLADSSKKNPKKKETNSSDKNASKKKPAQKLSTNKTSKGVKR